MIKKYNGHHCYGCWNVALWIGNDIGFYHLALFYVNWKKGNKKTWTEAARLMKESLPDKTPDGAIFTIKGIRSALMGMED